MKYYTSTTEFNCGIDLHAHQMYVCVMDRQGKKLVQCNIKDNDFEYFLKLIAPYRYDLTICAECMFGWYWLADACQEASLTFVLAHALYLHLKAIQKRAQSTGQAILFDEGPRRGSVRVRDARTKQIIATLRADPSFPIDGTSLALELLTDVTG